MDKKRKISIVIASFIGITTLVAAFFIYFSEGESGPVMAQPQEQQQTLTPPQSDPTLQETQEPQSVEVEYGGKIYTVNSNDVIYNVDGEMFLSQNALNLIAAQQNNNINIVVDPEPVLQPTPQEVKLGDIEPLRAILTEDSGAAKEYNFVRNRWDETSFFNVAQTFFNTGIGFEATYRSYTSPASLEASYALRADYNQLTGKLGIDDELASGSNKVYVQFIGDGNILKQTEQFRGGDFPIDVEVDVTGVEYLTIRVIPTTLDRIKVVFGDALLK